MNIDERLERLTERHEALAQSVGLQGLHIDKLGVKIDALVESVHDLVRVARMHDARIFRLEEQS